MQPQKNVLRAVGPHLTLQPLQRDASNKHILFIYGVNNVEIVAPDMGMRVLPTIELMLTVKSHFRWFATNDHTARQFPAVVA